MRLNPILILGLLFAATSLAAFHNHTWEPRDGYHKLSQRKWVGAYYTVAPPFNNLKSISGTLIVPNIYNAIEDGNLQSGEGITVGVGLGGIECDFTMAAGIEVTMGSLGQKSYWAWIEIPALDIQRSDETPGFEFDFSIGEPVRVTINREDVFLGRPRDPWTVIVSFENLVTKHKHSARYSVPYNLACLRDAEWVVSNGNTPVPSTSRGGVRMPQFGILAWTDTELIGVMGGDGRGLIERQVADTQFQIQYLFRGNELMGAAAIGPSCIVVSNPARLY